MEIMSAALRTRNIYIPHATEPYKLSRSKVELFISCPRCFYLDRRCGVMRPESPAYSLNNAVDILLKREFDGMRTKQIAHPLMVRFGVEAVPMLHPLLEDWRDRIKGIRYLDAKTNFMVFGAIDDVWVSKDETLHIVDYKATSSDQEVSLTGKWKQAYKRQLEIYQWLFRKNGFKVSDTGYFVYENADRGKDSFDGKLEFTTKILPYEGNGDWIEDALHEAKICLERDTPPVSGIECEWCGYRKGAYSVEAKAGESE